MTNRYPPGIAVYSGRGQSVFVGRGHPVRVNLSVGNNRVDPDGLDAERCKIRDVLGHSRKADMMMDLSVIQSRPEPWQILVDEFVGPVGVVPHYLAFDPTHGISPTRLMSRIERLVESHVAFLTIHPTPTRPLVEKAQNSRVIPVTSRGGSAVIRDMFVNGRERSIYWQLFRDITAVAAEYRVVLNLGTAFRSACLRDGLDAVTRAEIQIQKELLAVAREQGAMVTLEGPGHVTLSEIDEYVRLTSPLDVPLMPLGPMVTDAFSDVDHIINAIGAATLTARAKGGVINAVSRIEHAGSVPSSQQLIEALDAARAAAHAATISYEPRNRMVDDLFAVGRAQHGTCSIADRTKTQDPAEFEKGDCTRCGHLCPLAATD
jgi:phosphomethylpyrimidine synthase